MQTFEDMVDEVVSGTLDESAVISNYFLINYPYLQGSEGSDLADGACARWDLEQKFSEEQPRRFIRLTKGNTE